ncbi:hypothetical protein MHU86_4403 [Fragilaria crotonensis]|nr:hypothetical protein MHU86_4403 [Fragilaria crotonensis]
MSLTLHLPKLRVVRRDTLKQSDVVIVSVDLSDIPDHDNRLAIPCPVTNRVDINHHINKVVVHGIDDPTRIRQLVVKIPGNIVPSIFPSTGRRRKPLLVLGSQIVARAGAKVVVAL